MSVERKDLILYRAQEALGLLGSKAADQYLYGLEVDKYTDQGQWIIKYIKAVSRSEGNGIDDYIVDRLLSCLIEFSDIQDIPLSAPTVVQKEKPNVVQGTAQIGPQGPRGESGANANITVVSNVPNIGVEESGSSVDKTITLVDTEYISPTINVGITSGLYYENGSSNDVTFQISSVIGSDDIVSRTITSPAGFNLINTNFDDTEVFLDLGVTAGKTYSAEINDGTNTVSDSETIQFVYPILWGVQASVNLATLYADLTKIIQPEGDQELFYDLEGGDGYLMFAYPESYGDLSEIRDLHGDIVTDSFTKVVQNVTSTGLASNYTESYNVYYIGSTDLNATLTFKF